MEKLRLIVQGKVQKEDESLFEIWTQMNKELSQVKKVDGKDPANEFSKIVDDIVQITTE